MSHVSLVVLPPEELLLVVPDELLLPELPPLPLELLPPPEPDELELDDDAFPPELLPLLEPPRFPGALGRRHGARATCVQKSDDEGRERVKGVAHCTSEGGNPHSAAHVDDGSRLRPSSWLKFQAWHVTGSTA